jgi:hypothetical protein
MFQAPMFQAPVFQSSSQQPPDERIIPPNLEGFISSPEKEAAFKAFYALYHPLVQALYQNVLNGSQNEPWPKNLSISWPTAMYHAYQVEEPLVMITYEDKPKFLSQVQSLLKQLEPSGVVQKPGTIKQTNGKADVQTSYEYQGIKIRLSRVILT